MSLLNLGSNAHYDVGNESLVEPLRAITITQSAANPGGNATLWVRASDGALMLGSSPVTGSSLTPRARILADGLYQLAPNSAFELIKTIPLGNTFLDYGISTGTLTNPSLGIIKYNGTAFPRFNIHFVLDHESQGAQQIFQLAIWRNGVVTQTRNYTRPPINSIVANTFLADYFLAPGDEIGVAYTLSAGSNMVIHKYYMYIEIVQ